MRVRDKAYLHPDNDKGHHLAVAFPKAQFKLKLRIRKNITSRILCSQPRSGTLAWELILFTDPKGP